MENIKVAFLRPNALSRLFWNQKCPKVPKPNKLFGLCVGDFVLQYHKNDLQKKKCLGNPSRKGSNNYVFFII